jgi:sugar phosphate isomerase/epimerase
MLYGNNDEPFIVKSWGKKIFHVHVKDAVGVAAGGKFVFPLLGEGNVDFPAFFRALEEIGYDGCASVEFESWAYRRNILGNSHAASAKMCLDALNSFMK